MLKSIIGGASAVGTAGYISMKDKPRATADQNDWTGEQILTAGLIGAAAIAAPILVGHGAIKGAKGVWNNKKAIAETAVNVGENVAKAGIDAGLGAARGVLEPIGGVVSAVSDAFLKRDAESMIGYSLNGLGKATVIGAGAIAGIKGGYDRYNQSRMGQLTGASTSTPEETMENAQRNVANMASMMGAGGDLVFALNQNRRG